MASEKIREQNHAACHHARDYDLQKQRKVIDEIGQWLVRHKGRYIMRANADV
jgi:hypothetical protein